MQIVKEFINSITDLFFPEVCPFCNQITYKNSLVCSECLSKVEFIHSPLCTCCGKTFHLDGIEDHYCGECLTKKRFYTRARAILFYEGEVMDAIHRFKYSSAFYLARTFGWLMYNYGKKLMDFSEYDCIIPVPLHKKRLRKREFNQAQLLAEEISKYAFLPVELFCLVRIKDTASQVGLTREERQKNIRGAFMVVKPEMVRGKQILLIDDVISTTSTANEAARALKKAGAKRVDVLALSRGRGI